MDGILCVISLPCDEIHFPQIILPCKILVLLLYFYLFLSFNINQSITLSSCFIFYFAVIHSTSFSYLTVGKIYSK
ncbi:hypothetical protein RIF29_35282 [Crotalaria pallida]|uniref:Uncharacterized protein n=1 Tax=Crotalaria pallida TaxID=3830 RepID=A0AAN9EFG9_CROPI